MGEGRRMFVQTKKTLMKNRMLTLVAAALLVLSSCSQMNEQKYNDTVVNMYSGYVTNISSEMAAVSSSSDKQKSQAELKRIEQTTDSCIGVMNGLKPSDAAKEFHGKVLAVFQMIKTNFIPLASKMVRMDANGDADAYNKLVTEFTSLGVAIDQAESAAQSAQQAYASKIGMQMK